VPTQLRQDRQAEEKHELNAEIAQLRTLVSGLQEAAMAREVLMSGNQAAQVLNFLAFTGTKVQMLTLRQRSKRQRRLHL
jgi:hypothetical protein